MRGNGCPVSLADGMCFMWDPEGHFPNVCTRGSSPTPALQLNLYICKEEPILGAWINPTSSLQFSPHCLQGYVFGACV